MREQIMTVQVKGRMVIGLTDDGRFVRRRWRGPLPTVGALVSVPAPSHGFRLWALAATAAMLVLMLQLPFLAPFAQASTLVTVDINPSFELVVAPSGQVADVRALNADAEPIVASISSLPSSLSEALAAVLDATAAAGKLSSKADNLVLVGVTPGWRGLPASIDLAALEREVADDLDRLKIDGFVHVVGAARADLARARLNKLSVNRYLLVRELQAKGQDVTLSEARDKSAGQLLKDHGIAPEQAIHGRRGGPHKRGKGSQSSGGSGNTSGGESTSGTKQQTGTATQPVESGSQGSKSGSTTTGGSGKGNGGGSDSNSSGKGAGTAPPR